MRHFLFICVIIVKRPEIRLLLIRSICIKIRRCIRSVRFLDEKRRVQLTVMIVKIAHKPFAAVRAEFEIALDIPATFFTDHPLTSSRLLPDFRTLIYEK